MNWAQTLYIWNLLYIMRKVSSQEEDAKGLKKDILITLWSPSFVLICFCSVLKALTSAYHLHLCTHLSATLDPHPVFLSWIKYQSLLRIHPVESKGSRSQQLHPNKFILLRHLEFYSQKASGFLPHLDCWNPVLYKLPKKNWSIKVWMIILEGHQLVPEDQSLQPFREHWSWCKVLKE